jgi:hypothetical protein
MRPALSFRGGGFKAGPARLGSAPSNTFGKHPIVLFLFTPSCIE